MGSEENLELVHQMYAALNAQDLESHHRFWSEDMIWHGPPGFGDIHGIEGFKDDVLRPFYSTFPDYHVVNEIEVASENWVAATGILTGTPQHEWLGVPASGKSIVMRFSDFWRVENGKLSENWVMVDNIGVIQQLVDSEAAPWSADAKLNYMTSQEPTSGQRCIDLVQAMIDDLNSHDVDDQDAHWTENMIWHGPPGFGDIHGRDAFKSEVIERFYTAFPDFHGDFEITVADDGWVAGTGVVTGTHEGEWFGVAATGRQVEMRYSDFWRIEGDRLAENWVMIDHVGVFRQLGVDPKSVEL